MGRLIASRLFVATTLAATIVGCNALLVHYEDGYSGSGASSATGGHGGETTSSGGSGGHIGGDAGGGDADAGADPGHTIWARGFGDPTFDESVNAVAVGPQDHIFITGRAEKADIFGCSVLGGDGGAGTTGYLVELDPADGKCLWSYFFGADAEGTAVAVDSGGQVVLAGTFRGDLTIDPSWTMTATAADAFIAQFDVQHKLRWVRLVTDSGGLGDQKVTAVAINADKIAVAGTYTKPLRIMGPPPVTNVDIPGTPDDIDSFVLLFDSLGAYQNVLTVSSTGTTFPQSVTGIAMRATDGAFAVTGTTRGPTKFNGVLVNASNDENVFLGAYQFDKTELGKLVLGDTQTQYGRRVAFDSQNDIVVTGDFLGVVFAAGQGSDAGLSVSNTGGTDVLLARY
ncbi:MAG: hypothetical protein KC609_16505, partial [Myxococcales bacterium]|nr:hypothetical protein [Myxococcales bacterium]